MTQVDTARKGTRQSCSKAELRKDEEGTDCNEPRRVGVLGTAFFGPTTGGDK